MHIFKYEFKTHFRSVVIWSLSIMCLLFVFMSVSQSFATNTRLMNDMMQSFPKELLVAFGMENMDWSTILGFYGMVFLFCQVCLAIQAANYGFGLLSIEESELTADFLLTKPINRRRILTAKLLAAYVSLTITTVMVCLSSLLFISLYDDGSGYECKPVLLLFLTIPVFQLFFLSTGMFLSLIVRRVRSVTPFSMALVLGLYSLNTFGGMIGDQNLEILSPFTHFDASYILQNAAYDMPLVLISVFVILISMVSSYVLYDRRNIPSAL